MGISLVLVLLLTACNGHPKRQAARSTPAQLATLAPTGTPPAPTATLIPAATQTPAPPAALTAPEPTRAAAAAPGTWGGDPLAPPGRTETALAFDPASSQILFYGGFTACGESGCTVLGDTAAWNGRAWTPLCGAPGSAATAACSLGERKGMAMAGDAATGGIIMFGGTPCTRCPELSSTWL